MKILSLGYDVEADELDLLIDTDSPVPAESVPIGEGIYIRMDRNSGKIVGAFIRGYSSFIKKVRENRILPSSETIKAGFWVEFEAIVNWQICFDFYLELKSKRHREIDSLSHELIEHLVYPKQQRELIETLINV
ncbi:hypothetical protein H8E77_17890 [bacterium]|nr:hypothetical protein [bacterium]